MVVLGGGALSYERGTPVDAPPCCRAYPRSFSTSSPFVLSSLELSDTDVYAPYLRALLGTASHFCEIVVPEPRSHPNWLVVLHPPSIFSFVYVDLIAASIHDEYDFGVS